MRCACFAIRSKAGAMVAGGADSYGYVSQAGYWSAVTTRPGAWHDALQMPLLTRVRVGGGETLDRFARSLNP